jgi:metallo-beta-lactamase family protein
LLKIKFMGAAKTVTGSKYILKNEDTTLLIDCGLFQGKKEFRLRNWEAFPYPIGEIDAVVLTHAHIDHTGYLPLLCKNGFRGPIYATTATRDLAEILLRDSGRLQEEDANRANKYGYSKHKPALPLYTEEDAIRCLNQFKIMEFDQLLTFGKKIQLQISRAGHILGSVILTFRSESKNIVFTGDLGRPHNVVMKPPAMIQHADYLILESTYGNRLHPEEDPKESLGEIIRKTAKEGGTVLIPAFAVGRTQLILYLIRELKQENKIPDIPVYLDSPMAQDATDLMCKHLNEHRIPRQLCADVCHIGHYVRTHEESKALNLNKEPAVIIAASGMAEGGRVLHHIKNLGPYSRNAIVFVGFQAPMTRGERILSGEPTVKIHGEMIPIHAKIHLIENLSSHSDQHEILDWLSHFRSTPIRVFLTHGEEEAAEGLKDAIEERFDWKVTIPEYLEEFEL